MKFSSGTVEIGRSLELVWGQLAYTHKPNSLLYMLTTAAGDDGDRSEINQCVFFCLRSETNYVWSVDVMRGNSLSSGIGTG